MRQEAKRKQREEKRPNVFEGKNKYFPTQCGNDEETPEADDTLAFWTSVNNKAVSEGWLADESIQAALMEMRTTLQG